MLDRERIEYLYDDFKSRPERVRAAKIGGAVGAGILLLLIAALLSRGLARPGKRHGPGPKGEQGAASPSVKDAFAFAKELEPRIREDQRFAAVYFVPSAATANQKFSKIVVMGTVPSEADLVALQSTIARGGVPVTMEWQVSVETPGPR